MQNRENNNYNRQYNNNRKVYETILLDPRWRKKREEILDRDFHCCVICRMQGNLEVHHRQYHFSLSLNAFRDPWNYQNHLLVTLCEKCHQTGHELYKVPVKYID